VEPSWTYWTHSIKLQELEHGGNFIWRHDIQSEDAELTAVAPYFLFCSFVYLMSVTVLKYHAALCNFDKCHFAKSHFA
jgi:hypothetical protein